MKLATKHNNETTLTASDFSGGLNYAKSPEDLPANCYQDAKNLELDYVSGMLKTVDGLYPLVKMPATVDTLFYNYTANYFVASCGKNLYKLPGSLSPISTPALIGTLVGSSRPCYSVWDSDILIASGDKLQAYDNSSLTTIADSLDCDIVFVKSGRVVIALTGTDTLYYSGIGDYTNWIMDTEVLYNGLYIEIGYKDGGGIAAVLNGLAGNIIVVKKNGKAWRLAGDYDNWAEYDIGDDVYCTGNAATLKNNNVVFFVGKDGFKALTVTDTYGTINTVEAGAQINQLLLMGVSESAKIWNVEPKKQIWIRAADDGKIYLYHTFNQSFTYRTFSDNVNDVCVKGSKTYVAIGDTIYLLDSGKDMEANGNKIVSNLKTKRIADINPFLLKRVACSLYPGGTLTGSLKIGDFVMPIKYTKSSMLLKDATMLLKDANFPLYTISKDASTDTRCNYRRGSIEAELTLQGIAKINNIRARIAEVG